MQKEDSQETMSPDKILPAYAANVKVSDPEADHSKGFYTYLVSGTDDLGSFEIRRRYNDFFYFREALVRKWPGIYIPPIPQKKIAGNKDAENIEFRRKFFDYFMKRIAKMKHIFTSPITGQFLRNKGVDMEKFYSTMPLPKYHELVADFKQVYQKARLTASVHEVRNTILGFAGFLKKAEKELEGLKAQVEVIVEARAGFTSNLNHVNQTLLPDYEKNIYVEYLPEQEKKEPNLIFVSNPQVQGSVSVLKEVSGVNSFAVCLDHITYEILEVRAMDEALKIKEKYELELKDKQNELLEKQTQLSKLNSGKTTLKSFFTRGSKTNQIQKLEIDIPDLQKEIAVLEDFNNLLTVIFGTVEVPIFKRQKQIQYYRMMYEISENEIKYLAAYGEFMKTVLQGLAK